MNLQQWTAQKWANKGYHSYRLDRVKFGYEQGFYRTEKQNKTTLKNSVAFQTGILGRWQNSAKK